MELVKKELADVMLYCFDLAVELDIDLDKALNEKLEKVKQKYPKEVFNKKNRRGDPGTEAAYWAVKNKYRREGKN